MVAANRVVAEWEKRTREHKKAEERRKQEAQDRGEEVSSDDNDDDDGDDDDDDVDEVAAGVDWGILEDEGMLTNAPPSVQEPPCSVQRGAILQGWGRLELKSLPLRIGYQQRIGGWLGPRRPPRC